MPVNLEDELIEQSSGDITINFFDIAGNAVAPDTMAWTLTDQYGNIQNSRTAVAISSPSSTEVITLNGADLALNGGAKKLMIMYFNGTYTYNAQTRNLRDELYFWIVPLKNVGS